MARHELKTWPEPFRHILDGTKAYEVRRDDRGFGVGDVLVLREYEPHSGTYTGRKVEADVTYITRGFGLPDDILVMAIRLRGESHGQ